MASRPNRSKKQSVSEEKDLLEIIIIISTRALGLFGFPGLLIFAALNFQEQLNLLLHPQPYFEISLLTLNVIAGSLFWLVGTYYQWRKLLLPKRVIKGEERTLKALSLPSAALIIVFNISIIFCRYAIVEKHYVECWKPKELMGWAYARTPEVCREHGLPPLYSSQ